MTLEEKQALAGEYVLGLLEGADRIAFEETIRSDAEAAEIVAVLVARMQALDDTAPPLAPSAGLWDRIAARLDDTPQLATIAPVHRPVARPRKPVLGQWMAIAASVVVAAGLGFAAGGHVPQRAAPVVIAVLLNADDASPGAIVEAFADNSVRIVPLEDIEVPDGKILQVWTLPDPETGPVSLGTLESARDIRLAGPSLPLPEDGQLYEITLEPSPGSPTGKPTGPILVKGFAQPHL